MSRVQMQLPPRYRLEEIHIPQQQKCEKENNMKKIGEGWDHGSQSKEQAEAKQLNRKEAASKTESALAYAFSHQWRSSSKSTLPAMNLNRSGKFVVQEASNPQLGWSWLPRLMAGKPWERKQNGSPSCVGGARPAAIAKMGSRPFAGLPSATNRNGLDRSPVDLNKNHVASTQAAKMGSRQFATVKEQPAANIRDCR